MHLSDLIDVPSLSATDLTFGYEHIADNINVKVNQSSGGFPFQQSARASMTDDALYTGLQTTLWQRLTLTGQIRQDWVAGNQPFTWRLGAVLDVPEVATRFKAAYGTAFRAPSLFDRFGVDSFGYIGNPNLKPESAQGWEARLHHHDRRPRQLRRHLLQRADPEPDRRRVHAGRYRGERRLGAHPGRRDGTDAASGRLARRCRPPTPSPTRRTPTPARVCCAGRRTPPRSNAAITPLPGLTIAPELLITGAFQDFLVDDGGNATGTIVSSPHGVIANLTVTYDVAPHVQLYANGRNLFYSRFEPVNGYQTPGPSFLAGVRVQPVKPPDRDAVCHRSAMYRRNMIERIAIASRFNMRGILLWALGIPIPIIILLYLFHVI